MPGTARERFANPRAGAALAPLSGVPSRRRPRMSKVIVCDMIGDDCQDIVTTTETSLFAACARRPR